MNSRKQQYLLAEGDGAGSLSCRARVKLVEGLREGRSKTNRGMVDGLHRTRGQGQRSEAIKLISTE